MAYPYCHQLDNASIDHDQFLTYFLSNNRKEIRINQFNHLLEKMKIPSSLCKVLIGGVNHFYNDNHNPPIDTTHYTNTILNQKVIG